MSAVLAIPRYPADVTAQWLSTVLSCRGTPVEVAQADVVPIGTGQTGATYRVTATICDRSGRTCRETFVIKLPAQDDAVRDRVVIGYRSECAFYATVADRVRGADAASASTARSPTTPWTTRCCSPIRRPLCRGTSWRAAASRRRG